MVIVTGGSSGVPHISLLVTPITHWSCLEGVGRDICKQLLLKNAKVYLADKPKDHATVTIAEMAIETEGKYAFLLDLDLADLDAVNQSAETFLK